ncbi:MAG: FHA domain-containing protein [Thermoflexaceae bacterium]|nr:FHA domain-containing protein [Thermoflexaceae bacterium]
MKYGTLELAVTDGPPGEYPLDLPQLTIGRAAGCAIVLDDQSVSRQHARVFVESGRLLIDDLGSEAGTFVDGERVEPGNPALVQDGSELRIGSRVFRYIAPAVVAAEAVSPAALPVPGTPDLPAEEGAENEDLSPDIHCSLSLPAAPIDPGASPGLAYLTIRNRGRVVDGLDIAVDGLPAEWVRMSSPRVLLPPGEQAEVALVIQPPRRSESRAGDYPFSVVVTSTETGREVVTSGQVTIVPFEGTEIALKPVRSRRDFVITAVNHGNAVATYALAGKDDEESFIYEFEAPAVNLEPGAEGVLRLRVRPVKRKLFGPPMILPFRVQGTATNDPTARVSADGQLHIVRPLQAWKMPAILSMLLFMTFGSLLFYWRWPSTPTSAYYYARNVVRDVREFVSGRESTARAASNPEAIYAGIHMCDKKNPTKQDAFSGPAQAPYFSQRDPAWADTIYARSDDKQYPSAYCGTDFDQCGCGVTSVASVMALFQILTMPDGKPLTPKTVNEWFNTQARETSRGWVSSGYVYGDVVWSAVNQLSAEIARNQPGSRTIRFAGLGTGKEEEVKSELKAGRFVILELPGHYVAATGVDGENILINDPYYPDRKLYSDYKDRVRGSVLFEPSTDLSGVTITVPSDIRVKVTDAQGKVVGTLKTVSPTEAATDAQVGIKGATYRFKHAWRDPTCVESPPPADAGTNQITLPGALGQYKIEVTDPRGEKTAVAIHSYDRLGQVALRSEDGQGQMVIQMNYDPAKQAPEFAVTGAVAPGGGGAATGSATPTGATPQGGAPAVNGSGAAGRATPGGGATAGATPAGATPAPGETATGTPGAGGVPTVVTPTPIPPKAPNNVTVVCTTTYVQDPKNATVACNAAIDGAVTSQSWTINGVPAPSGQNKNALSFSFPQDTTVAVVLSACNLTACKTSASEVKVQFPPPGAASVTPTPSGTPTAVPPPAVTEARLFCDVTYDPYSLKRGLISCETTFLGAFTTVIWSAPQASPPSGDTGVKTWTTEFPLGLGGGGVAITVTATICNFTTCVTPDSATVNVQYLAGAPLSGGCSGVSFTSSVVGYAQWFIDGTPVGSPLTLSGGSSFNPSAYGPTAGVHTIDVLYGGRQVYRTGMTVTC